ncbi:MAG: hypothetical protein CL464_11175 [Acidimicrobiaceae bacterium]|nr:hypothetical protein [Acidimicrobiaceae bacterium]|tara:strand:+ start:7883 stop:8254 length:372 start_codon:yes stop_codon:yes gene_type:complete
MGTTIIFGAIYIMKEKKLNIDHSESASTLSDNLKYINNTVSHLEINRFQGVKDIMFQVVCKALTINVVTGKKAFVVWAVQEQDSMEEAVQMAKDELRNRIVMGAPVLQYAGPEEDIHNLVEYK